MIDEAKFLIKAGGGGNGSVSFRREKFVPKGGPDGGDGGNGGSVYFQAKPGLNTLQHLAGKNLLEAESGGDGEKRKMKGKNGDDLIISVPVGTQIFEGKKLLADLDQPNQRILMARGGEGGWGNWQFRSSTNTTPREAETGQRGEEREIKLELKVLAQVGLVGLPNAGKSTLLSVLTQAKPKIGSYPFTTLSPNLGVMDHQGRTLVVADIPGLIEGASEGKGLGIRFLKHIERCEVLVYVLFFQDDWLERPAAEIISQLNNQLKTVQHELVEYKKEFKGVVSLTVVNKIDLLSEKKLAEVRKKMPKAVFVSAATREGIEKLKENCLKLIKR